MKLLLAIRDQPPPQPNDHKEVAMKTKIISRNKNFSHVVQKTSFGKSLLFMLLLSLSLSETVLIAQAPAPCSDRRADKWINLAKRGNLWSQGKNWSTNNPPPAGGIACLYNGKPDQTPYTHLDTNATLAYLYAGQYNFLIVDTRLGGSNTLDVTNASIRGNVQNGGLIRTQGQIVFNGLGDRSINNAGGTIETYNGGLIDFANTTVTGGTLGGSLKGKRAYLRNLQLQGRFKVTPKSWTALVGTIQLDDGLIDVPEGTLAINGRVNLTGKGVITLDDPNSVIGSIPGRDSNPNLFIGANVTVQGEGTIDGRTTNLGTIAPFGGLMTVKGTLENDGLITVGPNDRLRVMTQSFTNNGSFDIDGTASVSARNEAVNTGTVTVNVGASATFNTGYVQNGRTAKTTVNGTMNITRAEHPLRES